MKKDYWFYRERLSKIIPRMGQLSALSEDYAMKEKGRKSNYQQYSIEQGKFEKMERLLDKDQIHSFLEVSLRAQSCPMPLNIDTWDGLKCPYACTYCFADYFRHSLYTSFFDNSKQIGLRSCNVNTYKEKLDDLFKLRGSSEYFGNNPVKNAVRKEIPMRLGIRFEDFTAAEKKHGVALELLKYLKENEYPVMINTKSALPADDDYVKELAGNPAGAAVHITLISSNEEILKKIEPGAPSFKERIEAARILTEQGVRVVARIEPWMMFINDEKEDVDYYISEIRRAGVKHLTFDSYSYSANSKGLSSNFAKLGYDFKRMFLLSADSQWMSSFMLGKFIEYFRESGFQCSTFDQGCSPDNDDWICCSVGDHFKNAGFNWGSGVIAIKFIQSRGDTPTRWNDFYDFVISEGGFLSDSLVEEVKMLWNGVGDAAWPIFWGRGITPMGHDEDGVVYVFKNDYDFRQDLIEGII